MAMESSVWHYFSYGGDMIVTFSDFPDEEGFYRHQIAWDEMDPRNPQVSLPLDCGKVPPVFKELVRILDPEIIKDSSVENVDLTQLISCPLL